jgi:CRP-like cAMP-binding protein
VGLAHLVALTSEDQQMCLEPGASLWARGAEPASLVLITDGVVSCVPEQTELAFRAGAGTLLGVDAAFGGTFYAYDATAETPVSARAMQTQMLLDLAEDHFDLAARILAHSAHELLRLKQLAANRGPAPQKEVAS